MTALDVLLCKSLSKSYSSSSSYYAQVSHYAVSLVTFGEPQPYSHYGHACLRALREKSSDINHSGHCCCGGSRLWPCTSVLLGGTSILLTYTSGPFSLILLGQVVLHLFAIRVVVQPCESCHISQTVSSRCLQGAT